MKKIPYIRIWTRFFDFKSKDSLKTFLIDMFLIFFVFIVLAFVSLAHPETLMGGLAFLFAMLQLLLPWPSLMVRRLRGVGYSPYWALFLLVPFFGFLAVAALCAFPNAEGEDESILAKKRKRHIGVSFAVALIAPLVPPILIVSILLLGTVL